jgi:CheY-like chemotaxis protein
MNILLVEDEAMTVMLMKMLLKQLGYTDVFALASGEKALAFVDEWKPDLVFMDILLAGKIDGIETTRRMLQKISCPVVYTTGYDSKDIHERAMASGAAEYLLKPVVKDDIAAVIKKIFG